ncbi:DUF11 domain-containing protein [Halomonas denitrificans]|nr:DUF11 domain-containing protein [Halomonas denitrificans]
MRSTPSVHAPVSGSTPLVVSVLSWLMVAGSMLAAVQASAFTLESTPAARAADGSAVVDVRLVAPEPSQDGRSTASLDLHVSAGTVDGCGDLTARIATAGAAECSWALPARIDHAGMQAIVRYDDGTSEVRSLRWSGLRGATVPQGVLALVSSGVHVDTDLDGVLDAGETIDYRYRLINLGSLALDSLAVTDLDGGVTCPAATLAIGADQVCLRSHVITAVEAAAGRVENVIEATGSDALGLPVQSSDLVIRVDLAGRSGIAVLKSPFLADDVDGSGFASLGDIVRYDFVATNTNDDELTDVELVEPDPSLIDTPIVCSSTTFDGNPFTGNGTGVLAGGDSVLCTATYEIRQGDVDAGQALNLVQVFGTNPFAIRISGSGATSLVLPGPGSLAVSKTVEPPVVVAGQPVIYTITVTNTGPGTLFDVGIIDPIPVGIVSFDWTCAGSYCPNPSGTGAINEMIPALPAGEQVVYTVEAEVAMDAPDGIENVVDVTPPSLIGCEPHGGPPPCIGIAPIVVIGQAIGVPALDRLGLVALVLLLALGVLVRRAT